MVRSISSNSSDPDWFKKNYRQPVDFGNRFMGKARQEYVNGIKKLGFDDVCECEFREKDLHANKVMRNKYQQECAGCACLVFPHSYIFVCDECGDYALADTGFLLLKQDFYCEYCA